MLTHQLKFDSESDAHNARQRLLEQGYSVTDPDQDGNGPEWFLTAHLDETAIVAPIVHLNGTSKAALLDNLGVVYSAIGSVVESLRDAVPNARDYYPQPGLMLKANQQHARRLALLRGLQNEIEREMDMIESQGR